MSLLRRAWSLLRLGAFIVAVLASIAWLHRLAPGIDAQRLVWAVTAQGGTMRYQSVFAAPPSAATQALYLESLGGAATIALNGTRLSERRAASSALGGLQPLLLPLPNVLLQSVDNVVTIELPGPPSTSHDLGAGYVGDEPLLAPHYAQRHLLRHTLPIGIVIATLVLGSVSLTLWLRRRQDAIYAWHALTCAAGSVYCALPLLPLSLPSVWLDALLLGSLLWLAVGAAWLGLCLADRPQPKTWQRTRAITFAGSAAILLAALVTPAHAFRQGLPWAYMAIIVFGAYTTSTVFWRQYLRRWDGTAFWMLGAVMCICLALLHDGALLFGLVPPGDGFWLAYGAPPAVIVFTSILLRQFVGALAESESLNRELEQRVAARELQIANAYEALQRAENERVLGAERERLFGDLHDGLGGTLVATLSRLSNEGAGDTAVALGVQAALEDLRLTLDSLNPDECSLRAVLAPLRERLANACADAGIALVFDLGGLADEFELPRPQTLHLLRIVQEAATNAVRHSGARTLRIGLQLRADESAARALEVQIDDDGCGMPAADALRAGHYGLATLRRRAAQLSGEVSWLPLQPGTRFRLRMPLG